MRADRRSFFAGSMAACLAMGRRVDAADAGTRRFDLFRNGSRIGRQSVTVSRSGSQVTVKVDVAITARIVGVPVYRYTLASSEVWEGGKLMKLEAATDDNGSRQFAAAKRGSNGLAVNGSGYSGVVAGNPGTTTYWARALLKRPIWISTQDGKPLSVTARSGRVESFSTPVGAVDATRWRVGGDLPELDLFYDGSGEWIGSEFQVGGATVRIETIDVAASLAPLWVEAP